MDDVDRTSEAPPAEDAEHEADSNAPEPEESPASYLTASQQGADAPLDYKAQSANEAKSQPTRSNDGEEGVQSQDDRVQGDKKATSSLDAWLEKEGIVWEGDDGKYRRLPGPEEPVASGATGDGGSGMYPRKRKRDWDERAEGDYLDLVRCRKSCWPSMRQASGFHKSVRRFRALRIETAANKYTVTRLAGAPRDVSSSSEPPRSSVMLDLLKDPRFADIG